MADFCFKIRTLDYCDKMNSQRQEEFSAFSQMVLEAAIC